MRSRWLVFLGVLTGSAVVHGPLRAQLSIMAPQRATQRAPGTLWNDAALEGAPFLGRRGGLTASRTQYLVDVAEFGTPARWTLRALSMRPFARIGNVGTTVTTTLELSSDTVPHSAASASFANNHGADRRAVFQGNLALPPTTPGTWPAAWSARLPFAAPFPFDGLARPTLTVEFRTTSNSSGADWLLEGYRREAGGMFFPGGGLSCRHSGGQIAGQVGVPEQDLLPGGALNLSFAGLPSQRPSLALNGLFFGARSRGGRIGPFTAPFPLAALGVEAAPHCEVMIGDLLGPPLPLRWIDYPGNQAQLRLPSALPIPDQPWFGNTSFFVQAFAVDVSNRGPELIATIPVGIEIGPGTPVFASRVHQPYDPVVGPPAQGRVEHSRLATMRFDR